VRDDAYRFRHAVEVRFRDLDPMGHAHHTLPLVYLEEARAAYWRTVAGRATVADIDYVMAEATVRFHGRIRYPGTLTVLLRTERIGGRSLTMRFEVHDAQGVRVASGTTVQVFYDYAAERSTPVPDDVRARIAAFEGLSAAATASARGE
jgi:acyl-CoA thioester hydrolase